MTFCKKRRICPYNLQIQRQRSHRRDAAPLPTRQTGALLHEPATCTSVEMHLHLLRIQLGHLDRFGHKPVQTVALLIDDGQQFLSCRCC